MLQTALRRSISHNNLDETERAKKAVQLNYVRDGNPPSFKSACAWTSITLPSIYKYTRAEKKFILDELFDKYVLSELEKCGALNWCPGVAAMMPMRTSGDGNCLMHAASLFMWGYHDRRLELRRAVYDALVKGARGEIHERWKKFREHQNKDCSNSMQVSFDTSTWDDEWMQVVDVACPRSLDQRFDSLEEIHIFVLASVLRRPIIVVSQHTLYSVTGEAFQPVTMGGIYLPLLCDPLECCKMPVVIGFANGHFSPLLFVSEGAQELPQAVPLVNSQYEPLPVHFKLQSENSQNLLSEYLEVTEMDLPSASGISKTINIAAFFPHSPPHQHIVDDYIEHLVTYQQQAMVLSSQNHQGRVLPSAPTHDELQQQGAPQSLIHDQYPNIHRYNCATHGCPNYGSKNHNYLCSECFQQLNMRQNVQGQQQAHSRLPSEVLVSAGELQRSNQGTKCITRSCRRLADPHAYTKKCSERHELEVLEESKKGAARSGNEHVPQSHTTRVIYPVNSNPSPNIQQLQNAQGQRCITPNCSYFADPQHAGRCSSCFDDFMLENTKRLDIHARQQQGRTRSNTVEKSSTSSGEINVELFLAPSSEPQNQLQQKQSPVLSPFTREVREVLSNCRTEGCTNMGSNLDYCYCADCFAKSVDDFHAKREAEGYSMISPIRRNSSATQLLTSTRVEIPPRSMSGPVDTRNIDIKQKKGLDNRCRTRDCEFYGNPDFNGFCSSCTRKSRDLRHKPTARLVDMKPEIPITSSVNDQPPPVPPRPSQQDIYSQIPCRTHGCARLLPKGTPNGLCDRCMTRSQQSGNSSAASSHMASSNTKVQPQAYQSNDRHMCPVKGCEFYGSNKYGGYCSVHFHSHGPAACK